jgi:biotin carboxyl carrier protein
MYSILVNDSNEYKIDLSKSTNSLTIEGKINDTVFHSEIIKIRDGFYHLLKDHKTYTLEIVKHIPEEKKILVKINNTSYSLSIKDKYDELLRNLGLDSLSVKKVNDVKAPMPGMVFNILVSEGQDIKKGDPLIVLEAMKMENVLKSPTDGTVKKIAVTKGVAVEKNQVLIQF